MEFVDGGQVFLQVFNCFGYFPPMVHIHTLFCVIAGVDRVFKYVAFTSTVQVCGTTQELLVPAVSFRLF